MKQARTEAAHAYRGKHGDAAVLELGLAVALHGLHVRALGEAERVPVAKGGGGARLRHLHGGQVGAGLLGRGGGGGDEDGVCARGGMYDRSVKDGWMDAECMYVVFL